MPRPKPPIIDMRLRLAIERLAAYLYGSGAYDWVDESIEIRLYGEAKEIFEEQIEALTNVATVR